MAINSPTKIISLLDVLSVVESSGNSHAMRTEPGILASYANRALNARQLQLEAIVERNNGCNRYTADIILATSWGRYQILGQSLYDIGYVGSIIAFADDPGAQAHWIRLFIHRIDLNDAQIDDAAWLLNSADTTGMEFATRYNGPGQPAFYLLNLRNTYRMLASS